VEAGKYQRRILNKVSRFTKTVQITCTIALLCSVFVHIYAVTVFDGTKKIIIRVTDSMEPGKYLDDRVQRHTGNNNSMLVVKLFGRFTGVGYDENGDFVVKPFHHGGRDSWLDPQHLAATVQEAKEVHCKGNDCEVILFCPSGIGTDDDFIADTTDTSQVNEALRRVEFMCERIIESGVDQVYWCNNSYAFAHDRFPEHTLKVLHLFNEKNQGKPYKALDIMTATKAEYPMGNNFDMFHPIGYTRHLTSHLYFKELCDNDGIEVPSWSEEMIAEQKVKDMEELALGTYISPRSGRYKLGDTIWVEWETDASVENMKGPTFCFVRKDTLRDKLTPSGTFGQRHLPTGRLDFRSKFEKDSTPYWGKYPYVVTEESFTFGKHQFTCPIPVFISLGIDRRLGQTSYPYIEKPDSMIILYPYDHIDPDMPIYPEALHAQYPNSAKTPLHSQPMNHSQPIMVKRVHDGISMHNGAHTGYRVQILDTRGRVVMQRTIAKNETKVIPLPQVSYGMYLINFQSLSRSQPEQVISVPATKICF